MSDNNGPPQNNGLTAAECFTAAALLIGIFWVIFVCLKWLLSTRAGRITAAWLVGIFFVLLIIGAIVGPPPAKNKPDHSAISQSLDANQRRIYQENQTRFYQENTRRAAELNSNCVITPTSITCSSGNVTNTRARQ